jgi:hypothetical protein
MPLLLLDFRGKMLYIYQHVLPIFVFSHSNKGGQVMKKVYLQFARVSVCVILAFVCLQSFSQVRGLKAMSDTIDLIPGIPKVYNILANDSIPEDDTIRTILLLGDSHVSCQKIHGATWVFTFTAPNWGYDGDARGFYMLRTMSYDTSSARILFRIHDESYGYLAINNVNARFSSCGLHFFYDSAEYEVPKGSGKTSLFANSLWIGGFDLQGIPHFAGERYRQGPGSGSSWKYPDFYAGPVMDSANYSIYQDTVWNYIWRKVTSNIIRLIIGRLVMCRFMIS